MAEHKVFKIKIDDGAFDKDIQRANVSTEKREFNREAERKTEDNMPFVSSHCF